MFSLQKDISKTLDSFLSSHLPKHEPAVSQDLLKQYIVQLLKTEKDSLASHKKELLNGIKKFLKDSNSFTDVLFDKIVKERWLHSEKKETDSGNQSSSARGDSKSEEDKIPPPESSTRKRKQAPHGSYDDAYDTGARRKMRKRHHDSDVDDGMEDIPRERGSNRPSFSTDDLNQDDFRGDDGNYRERKDNGGRDYGRGDRGGDHDRENQGRDNHDRENYGRDNHSRDNHRRREKQPRDNHPRNNHPRDNHRDNHPRDNYPRDNHRNRNHNHRDNHPHPSPDKWQPHDDRSRSRQNNRNRRNSREPSFDEGNHRRSGGHQHHHQARGPSPSNRRHSTPNSNNRQNRHRNKSRGNRHHSVDPNTPFDLPEHHQYAPPGYMSPPFSPAQDDARPIPVFLPHPRTSGAMYEAPHPMERSVDRANVLVPREQQSDNIILQRRMTRHNQMRQQQQQHHNDGRYPPRHEQHRGGPRSGGGNQSATGRPQHPGRLRVNNIPPEHNNEQSIREYFSRFGQVEGVEVGVPHPDMATVTFSDHRCASAAYSSAEAVFGNRFVTLRLLDKTPRGPSAPSLTASQAHYSAAENTTTEPPPAPAAVEELSKTREGYKPPSRVDIRLQQQMNQLKASYERLSDISKTILTKLTSIPKENVEEKRNFLNKLKRVKDLLKVNQSQQEGVMQSITAAAAQASESVNNQPEDEKEQKENIHDSTTATATAALASLGETGIIGDGGAEQSTESSSDIVQQSNTAPQTHTHRSHNTGGTHKMDDSHSSCIAVRNFPDMQDEDGIRRYFSQYGSISKLQIVNQEILIKFSNRSEATEAIRQGRHYSDTLKLNIQWGEIPEEETSLLSGNLELEMSDGDDDDDLNFRR